MDEEISMLEQELEQALAKNAELEAKVAELEAENAEMAQALGLDVEAQPEEMAAA
jgi:BMFP domain-containing protein YqiC